MTDIASLRVAIETGDVRRATAELDKLERAARRNSAEAESLSGAYGKLAGSLAGAYAAVNGGREFLRLSDTYAGMTARLSLVVRGTEELTRVQRELFNVAQQTRVGLEATSGLFGSLARSAEQLGASQNEVIAVTRTINQALTISGTSAASAAAALVQLNQAFASGVLRGEELNSVLEQAPALARAIADGLGVPIGQLRKLGEEGKLTADKVFAALQKSAAGIEKAFAQMPLTVGQSTTQAGNSVLQLVGEIDKLTGTSGAIARWVSSAAGEIDKLTESIRSSGGVFSGFFGLLGKQFAAARLTAVTEEMARMSSEVETAKKVLAENPGNPYAKDTIRQFTELAAAALQYSEAAYGTKKVLEDGSYDALEQRRLKGLPAPPDKPKSSKTADPYGDELKSLRERLVLVGQNTEADKLSAQISIGKFGKITAGQQAALLALASEIDRREQNVRLLQEEGSAREAASRLSQASLASSLAETQRLIDGNQALRDEIELLGATADAKTAIEVARTSSARALLEERAAILSNVEGNEAEVQSLRQQIELLRQREGLLTQRQDRQNFLEPVKDMPRDAANETYTSVRDALAAAFRDTKNPIKAFAEGLGNAIFSRVTSRLADALASQLVGSTGSGGLLGTLLSAAGTLFGGGVPVGTGTGATGDFARFDRIAGGRAAGGSVAPNTAYLVGEDGPEVLRMGRHPGHVTPNGQIGARINFNPTTIINVEAGTDQAKLQQIAAAAAAQANQQQLKQLQALGVL